MTLTKELLKKLKHIEIHTSRLANEQLAGGYHSVFKGRGMTFSEVRQYQPGDDVRTIDWNVSARLQETYIKVFREEREMTVILLVDVSSSGAFGTRNERKIETAAEVAALLAFSAANNNDQVGLMLFADGMVKMIPPKKGKAHVMRVVTEILGAKAIEGGTNIDKALQELGAMYRRRAIVFLISDMIAPSFEKSLKVASKKHDLIAVRIHDPAEKIMPEAGVVLFEDMESGRVLEVDTSSKKVREAYSHLVLKERAKAEQTFAKLKVDKVDLQTSSPETQNQTVRALVDLFRRREKRMR